MRREKARREIKSLIARGTRLIPGIPEHIGPNENPDACRVCGAWYNAVHSTLNGIYPTPDQSDLVIRERNRGGPPAGRVQNILDLLANFRDSIDQYAEPPLPYTWWRLMQESPLVKRILIALGLIVYAVLVDLRKEIVRWFVRMFK